MRVLIIDDAFTGWTGHNAAYNFSICEELAQRSIDFRVFAHQSLAGVSSWPDRVLPTFKRNSHTSSVKFAFLPSWLNRILKLAVLNLQHFLDLFTRVRPQVNDGDIVLVAIESRFTSFGYALWLFLLSLKLVRLAVVFVVHNVPSGLLKWEMRFLRLLSLNHRIILAAHTRPIAELCEAATGQTCYVLPLPFTVAGSEQPGSQSPSNGVVAFTYLGVASFEKGFDVVVGAIEGILDLIKSSAVRLKVQCNSYLESEENSRMQAAVISQSSTIAGLEVLEGSLSAAEFDSQMKQADVILIPNREEFYRYALSGVFTDALSRGKPVIVAEGTYMAVELQENGSGVTFPSGSPQGMAQAIRAATERINELRARALIAKTVWLEKHNAKRYVDTLLEVCRPNALN